MYTYCLLKLSPSYLAGQTNLIMLVRPVSRHWVLWCTKGSGKRIQSLNSEDIILNLQVCYILKLIVVVYANVVNYFIGEINCVSFL